MRKKLTLATVIIVILVATLTPVGGKERQACSTCIGCGLRWFSDGILNIGLFSPLGIAAAWRARSGWSVWKAILGGALLSASIEVLQLFVPGRDPELLDILFNTIGAAVGAIIAFRPEIWILPSSRQSTRLLLGWSIFTMGLVIATGVLLSPAAEPRQPPAQVAAAHAILSRGARLEITVPAASPPTEITPLAAFYGNWDAEWLYLGRLENDGIFRYRTKARNAGFDQPEYRVAALFSAAPTDRPLPIAMWHRARDWCIRVDVRERCGVGPSAGRGWSIVAYPDAIGQRWGYVIDVLWIAALMFPFGYWTRKPALPFMPGIALALLVALPWITGLTYTSFAQWLGAIAGFAAGFGLVKLTRGSSLASAEPSREDSDPIGRNPSLAP